MSPELSIIIPTLNEEIALESLLKDLRQQTHEDFEVLVVDGGSNDNTKRVALENNCFLFETPKGRATQLNFGAAKAKGSFFLFIHADSRLPNASILLDSLQFFKETKKLANSKIAGHFSLLFERKSKKPSFFYFYLEQKTFLNRFQTTNGDQGLLLARDFFFDLGGYDESFHFLEDQTIVDQIKTKGKLVTLPATLMSSARRFEVQGSNKLYILMSIIMSMRAAGVDEFFDKAKTVYQSQDKAGKLKMFPFFAIFWKLIFQEYSLIRSFKAWYHICAFAKLHTWQLFYAPDVFLDFKFGWKGYFFIKFYDRLLAPIVNLKVTNILALILIFSWYTFGLMPYFYFSERKS